MVVSDVTFTRCKEYHLDFAENMDPTYCTIICTRCQGYVQEVGFNVQCHFAKSSKTLTDPVIMARDRDERDLEKNELTVTVTLLVTHYYDRVPYGRFCTLSFWGCFSQSKRR